MEPYLVGKTIRINHFHSTFSNSRHSESITFFFELPYFPVLSQPTLCQFVNSSQQRILLIFANNLISAQATADVMAEGLSSATENLQIHELHSTHLENT
jgi:hypothetical protein